MKQQSMPNYAPGKGVGMSTVSGHDSGFKVKALTFRKDKTTLLIWGSPGITVGKARKGSIFSENNPSTGQQ